jgi:hypothetical protein
MRQFIQLVYISVGIEASWPQMPPDDHRIHTNYGLRVGATREISRAKKLLSLAKFKLLSRYTAYQLVLINTFYPWMSLQILKLCY